MLCSLLLEPALLAGRMKRSDLEGWLKSPHKYQRRAVPVALLKCAEPPAELLRFITPLMMDGERMVQQGLGWFLRELWKRHPEPVEAFLMDWKDRAPRVIYQYATEKMPPEKKLRFRKTKR